MAETTRDEWAKRVERRRDSDLTAKEFAAETGLITIEVIGAKPLQALLARPDCPRATRIAWNHLTHQVQLLAPACDRLRHQLLDAARTVQLCRVDVGHAQIDPRLQRRDRGAAVVALHLPRALPEHRHLLIGRPERSRFHGSEVSTTASEPGSAPCELATPCEFAPRYPRSRRAVAEPSHARAATATRDSVPSRSKPDYPARCSESHSSTPAS